MTEADRAKSERQHWTDTHRWLVGIAFLTIGHLVAGIWWASDLTARTASLEASVSSEVTNLRTMSEANRARVETVRERLAATDTAAARVEATLAQQSRQLSRIEQLLTEALRREGEP